MSSAWEWRVFWQDTKEDEKLMDVLETLQIHYKPSEIRTDTYVVCTKMVGIKWRGDRKLEIKVQSERDASNGAEKWTKV